MQNNRFLLTSLIIMTGATYQAQADNIPNYSPLVFGATYVSAGADAEFGGDIVAKTYFVGGADTKVTGSIQSGTAITLGANSKVDNDTDSGTATTLGASVTVINSYYGTAFTLGAGATSNENARTQDHLDYTEIKVTQRRKDLRLLDVGLLVKNKLKSTMDVTTILSPLSDFHGVAADGAESATVITDNQVVYNLDSLTTGAGITLMLKDGYDYVFNITDMLSLGAGTKIVMCSDITQQLVCTESNSNNTVTWNLGGYASIGEDAEMIGTVLANGYISTGVDSKMTKGVLYSETSYVTIGASGTVYP